MTANHFVSATCEGVTCRMCRPAKVPATHKVGEEIPHDDPHPVRHNLTAHVCCLHFQEIVGPAAPCNETTKVEKKPEPAAPKVLQDLLGLVLSRVPTTRVIEEWTVAQREAATDWAVACHLSAGDHDDVVVPPQPEFLKKYNTPPEGLVTEAGIWPVITEVDE